MLNTLRRFFNPSCNLQVSIVMDPTVFARLERVARHTEEAGDAILNTALKVWLDEHEDALLKGDEILQEAS